MLRRKLLQALPINLLGSYAFYLLLQGRDETFFLDGLLYLFCVTIGVILLVRGVVRDLKPQPLPWIQRFLPTLTGALWTGALAIGVFVITAPDRKANAFAIYADGGFNGEGIDFKTDGTYLYHNGSGLGESYRYGRYAQHDSLIWLTPDRTDAIRPRSNQLLIRPYRPHLAPAFDLKSRVYYLNDSSRIYNPRFTDAFRIVEMAAVE